MKVIRDEDIIRVECPKCKEIVRMKEEIGDDEDNTWRLECPRCKKYFTLNKQIFYTIN